MEIAICNESGTDAPKEGEAKGEPYCLKIVKTSAGRDGSVYIVDFACSSILLPLERRMANRKRGRIYRIREYV